MSTIRTDNIQSTDNSVNIPVAELVTSSDIYVGSVAELISGNLNIGSVVRTLGYYTPGDGGGNDYEIVAAGTGAADGGSFIDLDNGLQARGLFLSGVDVMKFGAKNDGSSDSRSNIQAAIDYVESSSGLRGGDIYFPSGDYRVDDSLRILGAAIRLRGESSSTPYGQVGDSVTSRIVWGSASEGDNTYILDVGDTTQGVAVTRRVQIENIGFDGSGLVSAIGSVWAPEMIIQGCAFDDVRIAHDCYASGGLGRNYSITWRDCYFHDFSVFALRLQADCHRSNILQCHFTSTFSAVPSSCIRVGDVDPSSLINIQGCNFEPVGDDGSGVIHWVDIRQGRAPTIIGNYFEVPAGTSIRSCIRFGVGGDVEGGMTASNRMVIRSDAPDYAAGKSAMQMERTVGHLITGNHFEGYNEYSVNVPSTTDCYGNQYIGNKAPSIGSATNETSVFNVILDETVIARSESSSVVFGDGGRSVPVRIKNSDNGFVELFSGAPTNATSNAALRPGTDNQQRLGTSVVRWSEVYSATGTINTSDRREKQQISSFNDAELSTARQLKGLICKFKWNDSFSKKGDGARWHFGVIAQEVEKAFSENGLNAHEYGMFCYDEWKNDGGECQYRYGIRYDQLLAFIIGSL